jgi:putative ABC transport system permease protein
MLRALARTAFADLWRHRLQTATIFVILVTATASLALAVTVRRMADGPFDRMMRETNGAHLWFVADPGVDLGSLAGMDGVESTAGPYPLAYVETRAGSGFPLMAIAQPAEVPSTGRPLIESGRWLQATNEVVVDPDICLMSRCPMRPGGQIQLQGPDGPVVLDVVGTATNVASWRIEGGELWREPPIYVLPETLERLAPDRATWQSVLGVRLDDGAASRDFAGAALAQLGAGSTVTVSDWHDLRDAMTSDNRLYVVLLSVFSGFALLAAVLVIANAIAGRVMAQFRAIGLLKALGFTPGGVLALYLGEHLALGLVAGAVGLVIGAQIAPVFQNELESLLTTTPVSPYAPGPMLAVLLAIEGAVALATIVPAVRGARVSTVQAITVGFGRTHRRESRLARVSARLRLPLAARLGLKDAFARPVRAWVTVASLALTVVTLVVSLGLERTLEDVLDHPEHWGNPFNLAVSSDTMAASDPRYQESDVLRFYPSPNTEGSTSNSSDATAASDVRALLAAQTDVRTVVGRRQVLARADGSAADFTAYALDGDVQTLESSVIDGRMFAGAGEAIAGQALLDALGLRVGDPLRLIVDGKTLDLRIVGRTVELDHDGKAVLFGLDTYRAQIDPAAEPTEFLVRTETETSLSGVMDRLQSASGGLVYTWPVDLGAEDDVAKIRAILVVLNLALVAIAVVNLLSTTMLGVRERFRDIGILKSVGLTPLQVIVGVLAGVGAVAVLALVAGIPLGLAAARWLYDELGRQTGIGVGLGVMPGGLDLAVLLPVVVGLALLGGIGPARRAAGLRVADALRYE